MNQTKIARRINFIVCLFALILAHIFSSCESASRTENTDINVDPSYPTIEVSPRERERQNPTSYLKMDGRVRKNLLGEVVIISEITNTASLVTYKDINFQIEFYSKTGTLLGQTDETIYEFLSPGATKKVKIKKDAPRGTERVGYRITDARY